MTGYNPLGFTPDGFKKWLHEMDRRLRDLERGGNWNFDTEDDPDNASPAVRNAAQLLCMSATGDSIAAGGDFVTFDTVVAQHAFTTVAGAGSGWTHPVGGVYVLTYSHEWATYQGGGSVQVELDGILLPEAVIMDGTAGREGFGTVMYAAAAGSVGRIVVTHSDASAQTCDATVTIALPDPTGDVDDRCEVLAFSDDFNTGVAAAGWSATLGSIWTGGGPDGSDAWSTSSSGDELVWTAPVADRAQRWVVRYDFYLDTYPSSAADQVLLGTSGDVDQVKVDIGATGAVVVYANGQRFISAAGIVQTATWQSWEIDATLDSGGGGAIKVTVDGSIVYEQTGFVTAAGPFVDAQFSIVSSATAQGYDNIEIVKDVCS